MASPRDSIWKLQFLIDHVTVLVYLSYIEPVFVKRIALIGVERNGENGNSGSFERFYWY